MSAMKLQLRYVMSFMVLFSLGISSIQAYAGAGRKSFLALGGITQEALGVEATMLQQGVYRPDCDNVREERIVNFNGTIGNSVRSGELNQCYSTKNRAAPAGKLAVVRRDESGREVIRQIGSAFAAERGDIFVTAEHTLTEAKFDINNPAHLKLLHIVMEEGTADGCKSVTYPVEFVRMENADSRDGGGIAVIKLKNSISSGFIPMRIATDEEVSVAVANEVDGKIFSFPNAPITKSPDQTNYWAITTGNVFPSLPNSPSSHFGHDIDTGPNSSGAPITVSNAQGQRVAIGVHMGGMSAQGYTPSAYQGVNGEGEMETLDRNNRVNEALKVNDFLRTTIRTIQQDSPGPKIVNANTDGVEA